MESDNARSLTINCAKSGLLGMSETSADMRDLLEREDTDVRFGEAVAVFCYQVKSLTVGGPPFSCAARATSSIASARSPRVDDRRPPSLSPFGSSIRVMSQQPSWPANARAVQPGNLRHPRLPRSRTPRR